MAQEDTFGFGTRAVHGGRSLPPAAGRPVGVPIHPSVGFQGANMEELDALFGGERPGYVYNRYGNPTVTALERAVADLEEGADAVGYSSGMGALHAAFMALDLAPGDAVVAVRDCYGATYTLLSQVLTATGVRVSFVDMSNLAEVEAAVAREKPRAIFLESVTNPLLRVPDLPAIVALARRQRARVLVDNTFATPLLLRPLRLGADVVIHSATKYLSGHGDAMGGVVVVNTRQLADRLRAALRQVGAVLSAFEAWLILRGMRTMHLRLLRQCQNATRIAQWLEQQPPIARVYFPGLASHPQHELATRLFPAELYGGMVSFDVAGADRAAALRFMDGLKLCLPVTTLGDVYTELLYPAMSSHRALTPEERQVAGIGDGLVRLSAGIEDVEDVLADLAGALAQLAPAR